MQEVVDLLIERGKMRINIKLGRVTVCKLQVQLWLKTLKIECT
jgi:hypothetical protein